MTDNFCYSYVLCLRIVYYVRLIYLKYTNKSGCNHNRVDKSERLNKRQLSNSTIMVSVNITMSYIQTRHRVKSIDYNQYLILSICMSRDQEITTTKGFTLPSYSITNNTPPWIFPAFWLVSKGANSMSDATFVLLTVIVWWCDLNQKKILTGSLE